MAGRRRKEIDPGFPFYDYLRLYYDENRGKIRRSYKDLTKKFLDYNDKEKNPDAFLRAPQFEALEMYVFLKEYLGNKQMHQIFDEWRQREGQFSDAKNFRKINPNGQQTFFDVSAEEHEHVFKAMRSISEGYNYPNYIYALAMGLGKTLLMTTCIFYEFLLANKYPKDTRFCHNALIFAPDLTVLQSLKEILTFDKTNVVPREYANVLDANIKFHFLDKDSSTLNTLDRSDFNIIISNTQKIIVKKKSKPDTSTEKLFKQSTIIEDTIVDNALLAIYGEDLSEDLKEGDNLSINQRFRKLCRLPQLGIYVDEAHHMFGADLAKALLPSNKTSLRNTITSLSHSVEGGSGIVGCYNFTGTPYIENSILPEVVYSYGLKDAIRHEYLKEVEVKGYDNVKNEEFLRGVITEFWNLYGGKTYDSLNPKLAIFGARVNEVRNEIKPLVEKILADLGVPTSKILVNVQDSKDIDIKLFNDLDKPESEGNEKQFILLVNKGREGWNCKSLFGVALFRKPESRSRVFILQATMRCLRKITDEQQKARVYLSKENFDILDEELQENFRIAINDLKNDSQEKKGRFQVRVVPPPRKIKVKISRHEYILQEKKTSEQIDFKLRERDLEKYAATIYIKEGLARQSAIKQESAEHLRSGRKYNLYTLVGEVAYYLNQSPIRISKLISEAFDGAYAVLDAVNDHNEVIYNIIAPTIFNALFEVKTRKVVEEKTLILLREPTNAGYYEFSAKPQLVVKQTDPKVKDYVDKSFHADTYCFDSNPEMECFWQYLMSLRVNKVYFTGMFTSNQGDFLVRYIDPDTKKLRSYYPDFLAEMEDGTYQIIEVKADNRIDDSVVKAKSEAAEILASDSKMEYIIHKASDVMKGRILGDLSQLKIE